jgi:hypothetical protein
MLYVSVIKKIMSMFTSNEKMTNSSKEIGHTPSLLFVYDIQAWILSIRFRYNNSKVSRNFTFQTGSILKTDSLEIYNENLMKIISRTSYPTTEKSRSAQTNTFSSHLRSQRFPTSHISCYQQRQTFSHSK